MEHSLFWHVAKAYVVKDNLTLQWNEGSVWLRCVFPCPHTSSGKGFYKVNFSVGTGRWGGFHRIYQHVGALVKLWLLVKHGKDSLSTSQCIQNTVKLLGHLGNRHGKGTDILQEGSNGSNIQPASDGQQGSRHG